MCGLAGSLQELTLEVDVAARSDRAMEGECQLRLCPTLVQPTGFGQVLGCSHPHSVRPQPGLSATGIHAGPFEGTRMGVVGA